MKLLFDQNLSPRLVQQLSDLYPGSIHVATEGLDKALDRNVWLYARQNELIIVSKDVDFSELTLLWGSPPNVIWIRRGNCSTKTIETILRNNYEQVLGLSNDSEKGILTLF